jgi:peptidylprolyl isomerase
MHRTFVVVIAALGLGLGLGACQKSEPKDKAKKEEPGKTETATPSAANLPDKGKPPQRKLKQVTPPMDIKAPPADAEKTASGMSFKSLAEGTGPSPGRNDGVKILYSAWREDGSTFATTEPANKPTTMYLYSTAPGFTEALQKMKVGGKAMFWLPPDIGFPGKPRGKPETLVYAVELTEIVPVPKTPDQLGKAPAGATKEKNGVAWKKLKTADGKAERPRAWDAIQLGYTGWDETGKIIDSSEVHAKPVKLPVDGLPAVFADAVPKLAVGERARLWFPGEMLGKGPNAPTGIVTFEVEVTGVTRLEQPPPAPPDVAKPPADAQKTGKGVFYKVLAKGTGTQKPTGTDQVTVHYTGWTTDGKRFDSSIPEGKPRQFRVTGVIPGWTDALIGMVVGDKWRVWIPEELAYKGAPNRPQGMLVFDVELLGIDAAPAPQVKPKHP